MKKLLCILGIFLGIAGFVRQLTDCPYFTGIAFADDADMFTITIQPDVMLILDVSGSMTWDMSGDPTWGDGSADYPGLDTDGDSFSYDSRLHIAKAAINRVVAKRDMFRWGFETFPYQKHFWHWADWYRDGAGG